MTGAAAIINRRSFVASAAALSWLATPSHASPLKLRVSVTPSVFRPMFAALSQEFQRRHPGIGVQLTASARDQDQQIQSTLRHALIGDLPDVSFEGFRHLRVLQERRIAVPLDALIAKDPGWTATYGDHVLESARVERSIVGLGAALSVPIIFYNADLVAAALGSNPLPRDWDGLVSLVEKMGRTVRRGMLGGFMQHSSTSWNFLALLESFGGSMMNASESAITFDAAPGRRALQIHESFGRAGQAQSDMNREQARQAFAAGAIALLVDSSSTLAMVEKQIAGRFRLGTASLPIAPRGRVPVSGFAAVLMARDSARQAAAWQFMRFVCGPIGQTLIGKSTGYFPANDLVVNQAGALGGHYASRPLLRPVVDTLPFASRWYAFPGGNSAKIDSVIVNAISSVITLSKTPDQALAAMRRTVQALLPESRT